MSRQSTEGSRFSWWQWQRVVSLRSSNRSSNTSPTTSSTTASSAPSSTRRGGGFSLTSLRESMQPEPAKRLYRLVKTANSLVAAHEAAARERLSAAMQLSEWGEQTGDEAVADVSDKAGVLLSELGELEDAYARRLDEARAVLKAARDTARSVQPSRDGRRRIADEMARLKAREPQSTRLVTLEQELVRAEAENLVAEAQLGNVTRQKLKEAYTVEFLATIERAEKQTILARHGLRMLQLLDDTPLVPGDVRPPYTHASQARQVLNDAEDDLREWRLDWPLSGEEDAKTAVDGNSLPPRPEGEAKGKQKEVDRGSVAKTDGGGGLSSRI